jgi:hypothetical protein
MALKDELDLIWEYRINQYTKSEALRDSKVRFGMYYTDIRVYARHNRWYTAGKKKQQVRLQSIYHMFGA